MIGEARVLTSESAQLSARGLTKETHRPSLAAPFQYFTSGVYKDASASAGVWSKKSVEEVFSGTRKAGNHVCRPDVCYKGAVGKKGFCRMFYLHWCRASSPKGDVPKRLHGLALQKRWDGTGLPPLLSAPPFAGLPSLEINQPFHFKLTPAVLLGCKANHDLGVLLRQLAHGCASPEAAVNGMREAMGAGEYYVANYAGKEQPHIEGLLDTLRDGVRAKQQDIREAREAGEEIDAAEASRMLLHRLESSCNRRMHKGFPEMLTFLLGKPMEYCSHLFVYFLIDDSKRLFTHI